MKEYDLKINKKKTILRISIFAYLVAFVLLIVGQIKLGLILAFFTLIATMLQNYFINEMEEKDNEEFF